MAASMEWYFAYGSNMSSRRLLARVPGARALGRAYVDGWRLAFNKPGIDGTGKANLVADPDETAWGVLYEIAPKDWPLLDQFEPRYERAWFRTETGAGTICDAQAYLFAGAPDGPTLSPGAEYLAHLLTGAQEHALPGYYIARIRAFGVSAAE